MQKKNLKQILFIALKSTFILHFKLINHVHKICAILAKTNFQNLYASSVSCARHSFSKMSDKLMIKIMIQISLNSHSEAYQLNSLLLSPYWKYDLSFFLYHSQIMINNKSLIEQYDNLIFLPNFKLVQKRSLRWYTCYTEDCQIIISFSD